MYCFATGKMKVPAFFQFYRRCQILPIVGGKSSTKTLPMKILGNLWITLPSEEV